MKKEKHFSILKLIILIILIIALIIAYGFLIEPKLITVKEHKITVNKASFLYKVCYKEIVEVNTSYSEYIKDVASNFTVTAVSDDGIIEAIEDGNILGVQWHPEAMLDEKLFKEFFEKFSNRE